MTTSSSSEYALHLSPDGDVPVTVQHVAAALVANDIPLHGMRIEGATIVLVTSASNTSIRAALSEIINVSTTPVSGNGDGQAATSLKGPDFAAFSAAEAMHDDERAHLVANGVIEEPRKLPLGIA